MIDKQNITILEAMDAALDTIIDFPDFGFAVRMSTNMLRLISKLLNAGYSVYAPFQISLYHFHLKNSKL